MLINWDIRYQVDQDLLAGLQVAADLSAKTEGVLLPCSISVCLCDDETITEINQKYRNKNQSTDVLSFPSVTYPHGKTASSCEHSIKKEYDDETGTCFLGDIFISIPHMKAQAAEYSHSEMRECAYLLVHGICHLMGYDHIEAEDKKAMRSIEEEILSSASITRDDNASLDQQLISLAKNAMQQSYSPYSSFPVGAALHTTDGRIFTGCNIENASFGLTNCAERTAVFKAVSEGAKSFDTIAIASEHGIPWPCGACRQVLNEFAPHLRVLVTWDNHTEEKKLSELLPESFGPSSLNQ